LPSPICHFPSGRFFSGLLGSVTRIEEFHQLLVEHHVLDTGGRFVHFEVDVSNKCNIRCRMCHFSFPRVFGAKPIYVACTGGNVWGAGGMIEFLQEKKKEERLGAIFCTTHGTAEYAARLVRSGVFDAIMVAYNPIGFHLLTYNPPLGEGRKFEHIPDFPRVLFPVALEHGVSILVMKALGGGLLARGRAFPPHEWLASPAPPLPAGDLLKYVLEEPGVCAVVAGVASPEEAEEGTRRCGAAHADAATPPCDR
jgi:hypothetical protein